jgi:hypothetical protein
METGELNSLLVSIAITGIKAEQQIKQPGTDNAQKLHKNRA